MILGYHSRVLGYEVLSGALDKPAGGVNLLEPLEVGR